MKASKIIPALLALILVAFLVSTYVGCQDMKAIAKQLDLAQVDLDSARASVNRVVRNMQTLRIHLDSTRNEILQINNDVDKLDRGLRFRISRILSTPSC